MMLRDTAQVLEVDHAAFEPFWRLNKLNMQRAVRNCCYPYVLTIKERVLGYVIADRTETHGYVSRIAVRPAHQGKGLGRALMDHTLSAMWRDGLDSVELDTQETNLRSRALYRGLGFCLLGRADVYWVKPLL
jgi:ribosomal-protein-alanine N-acetyltransferase